MKNIDHTDFMCRVNAETDIPPGVTDGFEDPGQLWKDADRQAGHKRLGFRVSINRLMDFFKKKREG